MLKSLHVRNFRGLEDFAVPTLGRVNLIVGKNNSGKSTVLEAVRILTGGATIELLSSIASEHGEVRDAGSRDHQHDGPYLFNQFFSGRKYPTSSAEAILIGEVDSSDPLRIEYGFYVETEEEIELDGEIVSRPRRKRIPDDMWGIPDFDYERARPALFVGHRGQLAMYRLDSVDRYRRRLIGELSAGAPCARIPTQFVSLDELADEWDAIALTDGQEVVVDALKIISPDFMGITFVRAVDASDYRGKGRLARTAKVKLKGVDEPVPLNSLGDGMLRMLQLVLKAFAGKGGVLLVDEVENGFHYSVQERVWKLLIELSDRLDVQIFATTHSWDCVKAFSGATLARPDVEGVLFRVGRSARSRDRGAVIATVFSELDLKTLTQSDVEVR